VYDLGVIFSGRLHDGALVDVEEDGDRPKAQLRLSCSSDDLLALTEGGLSPAGAWASGKLRIEASPRDLLRLRSLL
jgi:putative sterol carrier protein